MDNSRIIELMAKKMGNSASANELLELQRLLVENPHFSHMAEIVESLKGNKEHIEANIPGPELADIGWRHLSGLMKKDETSNPGEVFFGSGKKPQSGLLRKLGSAWRVAAAILLVAGTLGLLYYARNAARSQPAFASKSVDVKYGRRSELILSDGTRVWLNAGSRLKYPDFFSGSSREVELEGEAYFDVAQMANNPFLVHAGKITVKVLGTRFDVKAYREDAELSTTLISGKVQVMLNDDPEKKIILSSHEKLTVANGKTSLPEPTRPAAPDRSRSDNALNYQVQSLLAVDKDSLSETAWLENKLVFNNQTFGEVATLLERKYDVQIVFRNEALKQEHLSGVFEKETIDQVFDILRTTTRFTYSIKGKQILLATHR